MKVLLKNIFFLIILTFLHLSIKSQTICDFKDGLVIILNDSTLTESFNDGQINIIPQFVHSTTDTFVVPYLINLGISNLRVVQAIYELNMYDVPNWLDFDTIYTIQNNLYIEIYKFSLDQNKNRVSKKLVYRIDLDSKIYELVDICLQCDKRGKIVTTNDPEEDIVKNRGYSKVLSRDNMGKDIKCD